MKTVGAIFAKLGKTTRLADLRKKVPWDVQIFFLKHQKLKFEFSLQRQKMEFFGFVVCSMFFYIIVLKASKIIIFMTIFVD